MEDSKVRWIDSFSETALDDHSFKYVITNSAEPTQESLQQLYNKIEELYATINTRVS